MAKLTRRWPYISLVLGVVAAGLLPVGPLLGPVAPAGASALDRECTDDVWDRNPERGSFCINGSADVRSRGPLNMANCLFDVSRNSNPPGTRFRKEVCGGSGARVMGERVAQARFIQWLDVRNRARVALPNASTWPGVNGVHSGVQWEVATHYTPRKVADVLNYDPNYYYNVDPSGVAMDLWELKTSVNYGSFQAAATSASGQANAYSAVLKHERVPDKSDPQSESLWASLWPADDIGYSDFFTIEKRTCRDDDARGKPVKTAIDHGFRVFDAVGYPGAIIAERTVKEYKCREDRERENSVWRTENAYEAKRWWQIWDRPAQDREPVDPNALQLKPVPRWVCSLTPGCIPYEAPARERVVTTAALLRTDDYDGSVAHCDEYPFASTEEGGPGASLKVINFKHNKEEGRQIGAFYQVCKMAAAPPMSEGRRFLVIPLPVENFPTAYSCNKTD